ncbi:unnamed protein product, partial [Hymenolepis diminuta]
QQKELRLRNLLEGPVDLAERLDEIKKEEQVEKNSDKPEEGNTAVDATPVEQPESLASQNPNGETIEFCPELLKCLKACSDNTFATKPDTKDKERSVEKHLEKPGDAITDELAEEVQEEPKDATEGVMDSIKTAEEPAAAETVIKSYEPEKPANK